MAAPAELPTALFLNLVDRIQKGDSDARDELVRRCIARLERLVRKMLRGFPNVRRWEDTADVLQRSTLRLLHSLKRLRPDSTRAFFCLATEHVRRELIDLARHYSGPRRFFPLDHPPSDDSTPPPDEPADPTPDQRELERWQAFHEAAGRLPAEEREVFGLIFYHGWTKPQIAELFDVDERTVRRRWTAACRLLAEQLGDELPV